jgi:hypothetical protein
MKASSISQTAHALKPSLVRAVRGRSRLVRLCPSTRYSFPGFSFLAGQLTKTQRDLTPAVSSQFDQQSQTAWRAIKCGGIACLFGILTAEVAAFDDVSGMGIRIIAWGAIIAGGLWALRGCCRLPGYFDIVSRR